MTKKDISLREKECNAAPEYRGHRYWPREKGLDAVSIAVETPRLRERFNGRPTHYKLIADRKTKTLIGAQIISEELVPGTIDRLAVAMACRMPLMKLVQIAVPLHRLVNKFGSGGGWWSMWSTVVQNLCLGLTLTGTACILKLAILVNNQNNGRNKEVRHGKDAQRSYGLAQRTPFST